MEGKYKQIAEVLNLFERSDLTVMFVEFDGVRLSVSKNDGVLAPAPWEEPSPRLAATTLVAVAPIQPTAYRITEQYLIQQQKIFSYFFPSRFYNE